MLEKYKNALFKLINQESKPEIELRISRSLVGKIKVKDPYRLKGTLLAGKYLLEGYLGGGGMGAVYLASQKDTEQLLAIKILKPDVLARSPEYIQLFEQEISSVKKISHPNIVKIFDSGTEDDISFMVMELLEGQNLEDEINQGNTGIDFVTKAFRQICTAFIVAHEQNIIHLDIKPANIFILAKYEQDNFVKVIDFGLSKLLSSESGTTVTRFKGTDKYCSPEHFGGKLTSRSDIYSLGATLYHMLTGVIPFGMSYVHAKMYPNMELPPIPSILAQRPNLPVGLDGVIEKALSKNPLDRQESVKQLLEEFEQALVGKFKTIPVVKKTTTEDAFRHAALHDSLTNLANRANFGNTLRSLIDNHKGFSTSGFFVLFLDISRFKNINDNLGHTVGDKVLIIVAKRLLRMVNPDDFVARLGGDEFAIILKDLSSIKDPERMAQKIHQKVSEVFSLSGNSIFIDLNIGIAPFTPDYDNPEEILRDADIAMHYAKEKGSGVAVFDKALRARFLDQINLESDLRFAVERGELSIYYQPLISLKDGEIIGFEALLRWQHPTRGFISPAQFIPIAEDSGLIIPITTWILQKSCAQLAKWREFSPNYAELTVSVNISGKHLTKVGLIGDVEHFLKSANLPPSALNVEITESTAMENAERTIQILNNLKELGVMLSIDDFGTGYSSLSYLHRLLFDTLKIDRSFVYSVGEKGENAEILQTIISLAKNLKMRVIAEGIETENQLSLLQNLGCDYGQGYLMSKPLLANEIEELLKQEHNWLSIFPRI